MSNNKERERESKRGYSPFFFQKQQHWIGGGIDIFPLNKPIEPTNQKLHAHAINFSMWRLAHTKKLDTKTTTNFDSSITAIRLRRERLTLIETIFCVTFCSVFDSGERVGPQTAICCRSRRAYALWVQLCTKKGFHRDIKYVEAVFIYETQSLVIQSESEHR